MEIKTTFIVILVILGTYLNIGTNKNKANKRTAVNPDAKNGKAISLLLYPVHIINNIKRDVDILL